MSIPTDPRKSSAHLVVLFDDSVDLDTNCLAAIFNMKWMTDARCVENPEWTVEPDERCYELFTRSASALLRVRAVSQPDDTSMFALCSDSLTDEDKARLFSHKASVTIEGIGGPGDPLAQARFAAKVLCAVMALPGSIGYVSIRGQMYRTKEGAAWELSVDRMELLPLYLLLVGVHIVEEDEVNWIHTHGMDQFGCPEIEVRPQDSPAREFKQYVLNVALHLMEHGPVMKPGHTMELRGDGVVYGIWAATEQDGHNTGEYGGLEFVPLSA